MAERTQSIHVAGSHQLGTWLVRVTNNNFMLEVTIQNPLISEEEENLRWYLEDYALNDPLLSGKAEAASSGLTQYGQRLLAQLKLNQQIMKQALPIRLDIEECGQSAGFHGIHWEVLENPEVCRGENGSYGPNFFVRRIVDGALPQYSPNTTSDCMRILLVVSRHLEPLEAGHRMISEKLFDIKKRYGHGRLQVEIVRPGTFEAFEAHLERRGPAYFQAVHFDVHGSVVKSSKAYLHFLSNKMGHGGRPQIRGVSAARIGGCLRTYGISMAVLNSCDSAKSGLSVDGNLAQTFVKAGVPTVLAMSFKALASAVEDFFEVFYSHLLLQDCNFEAAVYEARRHLARNKFRSARFGIRVSVDDWISPVVYQLKNHNPSLTLGRIASSPKPRSIATPKSFSSVIGRDLDIFQLELQLHRSNILEVYGDSGVGKTVFLQHLSEWWEESDYVQNSLFLLGGKGPNSSLRNICREVYEVDSRISQEARSGALTEDLEDLVEQTVRSLRQHRYLVVLDDFSLTAASPDRVNDIRKFLSRLEGGQSLVIFTSTVPRTRAARYHLEGLPRFTAIELSMTRYRSNVSNELDEVELRYLDWLLDMMRCLPACIEVIISALQDSSCSPRLLYEALLKGSSALNESNSKTVRPQVYLTTSAVYYGFRPSIRNIVLLFSPFWGYIPADVLDSYLYLVWRAWELIFPQRAEIPGFHGNARIAREPSWAADASDYLDPGHHSLLHAVDIVRENLTESGLWALEISHDGARVYRIHPLFTLCIRKIAEEQGDNFAYEKLLRTFAMWHRSRDLCLWTDELLSTTDSTIVVPAIGLPNKAGQGLGVIKQVQWTEEWLCERTNVLTSFYVGLTVESDEAFPAIFPAACFYHIGNGVSNTLYTDHMEKNPGLQVSKLEISPPSPYLIMELAEQVVKRVRRILEAGNPLDEAFFIHSLDNGYWTAKFHFQYASPSITQKAFDNFIFIFRHTSSLSSIYDRYLRRLKFSYTVLQGGFYLSLLDDYTQDNTAYCLMDEDFLSDIRKLCKEEDGEVAWVKREYCRHLYVSFRESNRYGSIVKNYESQHGSIDIDRDCTIDSILEVKDALQLVDDRFGYNQSRSTLLRSLDRAMDSGNVQLQLSIHSQLCSNCFQAGQWSDAGFHANKTLQLDRDIGALDFGARLHIEYTRAAIAKEVGDLKGAEEIALESLSKTSPDQWPCRFDIFVLLAQVQLHEGSDRWATIESSIAALRIAYAHYKDYSLMNHKPGQLFAFIFQSLWSETRNGSEIVDEDIERLSKMLGSSAQEVEARLSEVNEKLSALSKGEGGRRVALVFAQAEHSVFGSFGLETGQNDEDPNEQDQSK